MCFKDSTSKTLLYKQYMRYETNELYKICIKTISNKGIEIQSIIRDGRKGLFTLFENIPVQMCQRHQIEITRRYLTRNPKLQVGKEFIYWRRIITHLSENEFMTAFKEWATKWTAFLNERTKNERTVRTHFTHKKPRSAWRSLKNNFPYLFCIF